MKQIHLFLMFRNAVTACLLILLSMENTNALNTSQEVFCFCFFSNLLVVILNSCFSLTLTWGWLHFVYVKKSF